MRRKLDQYFTPVAATKILLAHVPVTGTVVECCSGTNQIALPLWAHGLSVLTNDVDPAMPAISQEDATQAQFWEGHQPDWVISNPPFSCCHPIILHALQSARLGVAMLLRLSYAEPCNDRAELLTSRPPSLMVLPRMSFTGDGKTDNVTCGWFIWDFQRPDPFFKVVSKDELRAVQNADAAA
jgi:hypothetical protein